MSSWALCYQESPYKKEAGGWESESDASQKQREGDDDGSRGLLWHGYEPKNVGTLRSNCLMGMGLY